MRILLVEDKPEFASVIEKAVRSVDGCELSWKKSKASALAALADQPYDLVILDRRIPTDDDVLDDHEDHGWAVFQSIREQLPGTSVWFLTGTRDADFATEMLNAYGRQGDIHSCGRDDAVYRVFWKDKLPDCIAAVRAFRAEVHKTEAINVVQAGEPVNLRHEEMRLLRLFARKHDGASVEIRSLSGGLSDARVLRVSVLNAAGARLLTSVAKVGSSDDILLERTRYQSEIVRLATGSFPQVTGEIALGASNYAAIFYGVVGAEVCSLFDKLVTNPKASAAVPAQLRAAQATWLDARVTERVRVATVRRKLIGDVALEGIRAKLGGIDLNPVDRVEILVATCVQHGDLHCANVLFDDGDHPMFIDYPAAGRSLASLDPIVLELGTIFHKDAPARAGWPTEEQAGAWPNIEAFSAGASFADYLQACRAWAMDVAGSEQEVLAVGYSYALRQLKYDDTDRELALAIIRACIARLLEGGGQPPTEAA